MYAQAIDFLMLAGEKFRLHLQNELRRRTQSNAAYSIRSFARHLSVDPSFLAKILAGKRSVTQRTVIRFSEKLGLAPQQVNEYIKEKNLPAFSALDSDHFECVADWEHYAILELIQAKDFQPEISHIAKRLGISRAAAQAAVERLQRLGLLTTNAEGKWISARGNNTTTAHPYTNSAFRQLQKQILQQALEALESIPLEKRDQSSITMCIDPKKIPEAKERIKKFRRELMEFLEASDERTSVYQLSISLFPVSKNIRGDLL